MKKLFVAIGVAAVSVFLPFSITGQEKFVTLDRVGVNGDTIKVSLSGPAKYHAFKISNPPRVVVEFTNTEFNAKNREISVNGAIVKRVRSTQFKNDPVKIARVVVDLNKAADYELVGAGKLVTLSLKAAAASRDLKTIETNARLLKSRGPSVYEKKPAPEPVVKTVSITPAPAPITPAPALTPAPVPVPDKAAAEKPAPKVAVTLPVEERTPAPAPVVQPAKPAAPVATVTPAVPAVPAKPKSVTAAKKAPATPKPAVQSSGKITLPTKPITIEAQDMDIRDVLRIFSSKSGINIIYGPDVTGTVTLLLENVPFDKAFETILSLKGLVSQEMGANILRVSTPEKIAAERANAVTFTKVFPLNYAKADEVKVNLDSIRNAEGRRGNISVDARTNSLIITDTPEGLTSLERIITDLDRKPEQVIIEAKIVEVVLNNNLDLGIDWQYSQNVVNDPGQQITIGDPASGVNTSGNLVSPLPVNKGGTGVALGALPQNGQIAGISFGVITNQMRLSGMLTALATKGLSKLLSTPKVTTINNKEARILVGQRIPYTTTTVSNSGSTQSTNFMDVGIKLTVTPTINIDQKITLQVHPEVSLFVRNEPAGPVIGTREAMTTVIVSSGETVVIGGLITEDDKKLGTQVPLLGDLPVIGHLFKRQTNTKERTELLVFLTPQIVN